MPAPLHTLVVTVLKMAGHTVVKFRQAGNAESRAAIGLYHALLSSG